MYFLLSFLKIKDGKDRSQGKYVLRKNHVKIITHELGMRNPNKLKYSWKDSSPRWNCWVGAMEEGKKSRYKDNMC